MTAVLVRRAREEDLAEVLLLANSIPEAPGWTQAMYGDYLLSPEGALCRKALWLAFANGSLQGFAAATVVAGRAELESIAVDTAARHTGVGGALVRVLRTWAQEHAAARLELEVRAANGSAWAFYAAHGFRVEGRRARYYRDPDDDALLMTLDLATAREGLGKPSEL